MKAKLKLGKGSHKSAVLVGESTVPFKDGWANFTDLGISRSGSDYTIELIVSQPVEATKFKATTLAVTIKEKILTGKMVTQPSKITKDAQFSITSGIADAITLAMVDNVGWKVSNAPLYSFSLHSS